MLEHIRITENKERGLIVIQSDYSVDGLYLFLKDYYTLILQRVFSNSNINLVTTDPLKSALAYEIGNYIQLKIENNKLLVNAVQNATSEFLKQVACSIEFELGTLGIIKEDRGSIEERSKIIYKWLNQDIETSNEELFSTFCYCEPDGYIIYLVGTELNEENLKLIAQQALSPHFGASI